MVKRPKSPEIVEDARFFTVYQPYPLNPDWHEEDDQIEAAKWVAECIGPNHLWAIHEKPRVSGTHMFNFPSVRQRQLTHRASS
jgi:hypothetical protein